MSSREKKHHREHVVGTSKDEAVRLFAFANTRPSYCVVFSPEQPLIVLKTKAASSEHPCKQWAPFASLVFAQRPNTTHALYVADTTALPESVEREETVAPVAGPLVRRLANAIARLNPHNATMVAAGVSSSIALKYVIGGEKTLGHRDRLVRHLIVVCPPSPRQLQTIVKAAKKQTLPKDYPRPRLAIILSEASQEGVWRECLQEATAAQLLDGWSITLDLKPSLFAAIAREAGVQRDDTTVDVHTRFTEPRLYRIDFVLSKDTKKTEQHVTLSSLDTDVGHDDDDDDDDNYDDDNNNNNNNNSHKRVCKSHVDDTTVAKCADGENDASSCCDSHCGSATPMLVYGLTSLQHCQHPTRVAVEGRVMAGSAIGTTQGSVVVRGIPESLAIGSAVRAECCIHREPSGQTVLVARRVARLTRKEERSSMTVCRPSEVPPHNVSAIAHAYGVLLVRGRKCVLVCSLQGTGNEYDMKYNDPSDADYPQMPMARHSDPLESATDCAVRAVCCCCEVSPDTFYLPSYCPPACYYTTDTTGARVCATLYLALAVAPPPRGAATDAAEEPEEPGEPYNWYGFARARAALRTEAERGALDDLCRSLRRARDAGLYSPAPGLGLFGDALRPAGPNETAGSFSGLELMVIVAPGAGEEEEEEGAEAVAQSARHALRVTGETARDEITAAAQEAQAAGEATLALCLAPDVEVLAFYEDELTHWTEVCGATARVIALLFPSAAQRMASQRDAAAAEALDAFVAVAPVADALVVATDAAESFAPETWAMLRLATRLNTDLALCAGIRRCRPVDLPPEAAEMDTETTALREIVFHRDGRPVAARRLAPLLECGGLRQCCGDDCALLWADGDVWLASRPLGRGVLSFDAVDCCLTLEEGEAWEAEEPRATTITLHVWATRAASDNLERAVGAVLDGMLCESATPSAEELKDDLPPWE